MRAPRLLAVALDRFLHPEGGVTGADGVILMRNRCAEKRHDAVAHHLVHGALVAVHGVHHVSEDGIEDLARFPGIAIGEQPHRTLQVGEEYCHLLAFTFEGGLRRKNSFGEMLRRERVRRPGRRACRGRHSLAAFQAELRR